MNRTINRGGWPQLVGAVLIVAGLRRGYAPDRYIGITVLAMTILKVFFYDLWELGGIYRVIGFIAFGVLLMAVSYLYQQRAHRGGRVAAAPNQPDACAFTPPVSVPSSPAAPDESAIR